MTRLSVPADTTVLVGVLNVTPDSFSDGGAHPGLASAVAHGLQLHRDGAHIIDVGGESTRPGATPVDPAEEQRRALPVVAALAGSGLTVSIDTMHATTAEAAVKAGAVIVNDVSGGLTDPDLLPAIAPLDCQIVLGHLRGTPETMTQLAVYDDVVREVREELSRRIDAAVAAGITPERIIVDPGIGFAKTPAQSWAVLRNVGELRELGFPMMAGVSRKRFLAMLLPDGAPVTDRDLPTAVLSALLTDSGVNALRVHDVRASAAALRALTAFSGARRTGPARKVVTGTG